MKHEIHGFICDSFDAGYYDGINGGLCEYPSNKDYMKGYNLGQNNFN